MSKFLIISLLALTVRGANAYYCSYAARNLLCKEDVHIVCKPHSVATSERLLALVPMTNLVRDRILELNNGFRNDIAGCKLRNEKGQFGPALAMRELIWDTEFEFIARMHASRCTDELDKCHGTLRIRNMSQLVAFTEGDDVMRALDDMFTQWTDELKVMPLPIFGRNTKYNKFLHRTRSVVAIMNDRSSRVGCGLSVCDFVGLQRFHMTCYYENPNEWDVDVFQTVLKAGDMKCSMWNTAESSKYEFLCQNSGQIFPPDYPHGPPP